MRSRLMNSFLALCAILVFGALNTGCSGCDNPPAEGISVSFLSPAADAELTDAHDEDQITDGVQIQIQLSISGFTGSGSISVQLGSDAQTLVTVSVSGSGTYVVDNFTLQEGENLLVAALVDSSGSLKGQANRTVTLTTGVVVDEPTISFTDPASDGLVLTASDDLDLNPSNGFQYNVAVATENVPVGTQVSLEIENGSSAVGSAGADGTVVFPSVTLPETGANDSINLTAEVSVGDQDASAVRIVSIDTGACTVSVTPADQTDACEFVAASNDADPGASGFQAEIVVATDCSDATLVLNGEDIAGDVVSGTATFVVTLDQGRNIVRAEVSDDSGRSGVSDDLIYQVDTEAPSVTITEPDPDGSLVITTIQDRDDDPENGVQIDVAGTIEEVEEGTEVALSFGDEIYGTTETDGDGDYRFENVSFTESDSYTLAVLVIDECGNEAASPDLELDVIVEDAGLIIVSPEDQDILLADGDMDEEESGYQTDFVVTPIAIDAATSIEIECRRLTSPLYSTVGASDRGDGETTTVTVTLGEGQSFCRARASQDERTYLSTEVELLVDSDGPEVEITSPVNGSSTASSQTDLAAFVRNLDADGTAEYQLNDDDPIELTVVDEGVFVAGVELAEGENTLSVEARDESGNQASDLVTVTYDTAPPELAFDDPSSDSPELDADDLHGDSEFGEYLYDVVVSMNEAPLDDQICLTSNGLSEVCTPATAVADRWEATFEDTFILPLDNDLDARADDLAGLEGTAHLDLTVDSALPRLEITKFTIRASGDEFSPVDGVVVAGEAGELLSVDVEVSVDQLPDGDEVVLITNGIPGRSATPTEGIITFTSVNFQEGDNLLQAIVVNDGARATGFSAAVGVEVDTTIPGIAFDVLTEGFVVTTVNSTDQSPEPGFQLAVAVTTDDVEDGQTATLTLSSCSTPSYDGVFEADVEDDATAFVVPIPDVGSCTFSLDVADRADQPAETETVVVTIDVEAPQIRFLRPENDDFLDQPFDDDLDTAGLQTSVRIEVIGGEPGNRLFLTDSDDQIDESLPVDSAGREEILFSPVTLLDGFVTLTAETSDAAGNVGTESITVSVSSTTVTIRFQFLNNEDVLNIDSDVGGEAGLQIDIPIETGGTEVPGETVVLCRFGDGETFEGSRCVDDGYEEIAVTTMVLSVGTFTEVSLDEGDHRLSATLLLGGAPAHATPITVTVDTVRPTLDAWRLTNNDGTGSAGSPGYGDDFLNATETGGSTAAVAEVDFGGLGGEVDVSILSGTTEVASGRTTGTFLFTTVDLGEGPRTLSAKISDIHDNELTGGAPLEFTVDISPPSVTWLNPTDSAMVLAAEDVGDDPGAQITGRVRVVDGPNDSEVAITGTVSPATLTVTDLIAAGEISIAETGNDSQPLTATGRDEAFNTASATINVWVDVTAPEISVLAPSEEDLALAEVPVSVVTSYAEAGQTVTLFTSFLSGTPGRFVGSGIVGGGDDPVTTVITETLPGGSQFLTASVSDDSGNVKVSEEVAVTVPFSGCGISFDAPTAGEVHVTSLTQDFQFSVADECAVPTPTDVSLRIGCGDKTDAQCVTDCERATPCVYTLTVDESGIAFFDDIPFADGETVLVEGETEHPSTSEFSTTESKTIIADATAPQVSEITSPAGSLSIADLGATWSDAGGGAFQGPVVFTVSDIDSTTVATVSYNGTALITDEPITPLTTEGVTTIPNLVFPTVDEAEGAEVEVVLRDRVGNSDFATAALNVDGIAPAAPGGLDVTADIATLLRTDQSVHWDASGDDGSGAGTAATYQWVWAPVGTDLDADWDSLEDPAPSSVSVVPTEGDPLTIPWLDLESDFEVGVRAYDEVGNGSTVASFAFSTDLSRASYAGIGPHDYAFSPVGDVNGDGRDDLVGVGLSPSFETVIHAYLGEETPGSGTPLALTADPAQPTVMAVYPGGDLDDDGLNDFVLAATTGWPYSAMAAYIYFGCETDDDDCDLATPDVKIALPGTANWTTSHIGWGDYIDFGPGAGEGPYDDLRLQANEQPGSDLVIIAGRDRADWPAWPGDTLSVLAPSDSACTTDGILWLETSGLGTWPGHLFGNVTLFGDVDDNGSADLAVGGAHMTWGNESQTFVMHVLYDHGLASCPSGGVVDLSDPPEGFVVEAVEMTNPTWCCGDPNIYSSSPHLTFAPAITGDGARPARLAFGYARRNRVFVYEYDSEAGAMSATFEALANPGRGDLDFGMSQAFVGNLDGDLSGADDLVVTNADLAASSVPAEIWFHPAATYQEGMPDFPIQVEMDVETNSRMGARVVGGFDSDDGWFDFNGDDLPDVAIVNSSASANSVLILY